MGLSPPLPPVSGGAGGRGKPFRERFSSGYAHSAVRFPQCGERLWKNNLRIRKEADILEECRTTKEQIIREMEEARYIVGCMPEGVRIRKVDLYGDAGSIGVAIILQEGIEAAARTLGKTVEREAVPESWGMRLSAFLSFRAGRAKVYQLEERRGV